MDTSRIVIPVIVLAAGVAAFFALGKKEREKTEKPQGSRVRDVVVVPVDRHDETLDIGVNGQAVPYQEIELSAEVAGKILYKAEVARAGRFAQKDTVLLRIDDRDYSLMVQQLDNELKQADVSVQELDEEIAGAQRLVDLAQDQVGLAEKDYKRQVDLHRRGASTDSELDQSRGDLITAENSLTTIRNQFNLLKTRHSRIAQAQTLTELKKRKAEYDLERATIKAPVNGVIVQDSVEQGDYVTIGTPLLTIEDTTTIEVKCNLQMDELYWVWDQATSGLSGREINDSSDDYQIPRTPATVIYRLEGEEYTWDGELWRIDGVGLDEKTRTVPCCVIVRSPQAVWVVKDGQRRQANGGPPALVRGMYVDVLIHTKPSRPLLSIPQEAIRPGPEIWLARPIPDDEKKSSTGEAASATHTFQIVKVDVIGSAGERAVVRANPKHLPPGSKVIVSPLAPPVKAPGVDEAIAGADDKTSPGEDDEAPSTMLLRLQDGPR
jgi:biotin carboxyl carrier protein